MIIQEYLSDINSAKTDNTSAEQLENILITTAKLCLKIRTTRRHKRTYSRSNKKWFDKECRLKRHELRKLSNEKHRDPLNTTLCEKYQVVLQYKRNEYYNNKLSELEDTTYNLDTKIYWNCFKSMDDSIKYKDTPPIAEENWMNYFQCRHSNKPLTYDQQNVVNELRTREDIVMQSRPLDYFITEAEISKAARKLKNNKSAYSEKIRNEMIKASLPTLLPATC